VTTTVPVAAAARSVARSWSPSTIVVTVLGWISVVLVLDADGGRWLQRGLGVLTWLVLASLLARESWLVRVQTAVVVVFAAAVEYTFAPLLEVYTYRFDNVPMYVPPGHGLVYLAALAIGRTALVSRYWRVCTGLVLLVGGTYAAYGVVVADRADALGALWFGCLVGFLRWGPSPGLYIGAFLVVTYLEIAGTTLGTWTWGATDPTGLVSIGNPPSGAAGGYGWFDLAATLAAPGLLARWNQLTADRAARGSRREGDRWWPRRSRPADHPRPRDW
jgi:hypothetical protein